MKSWICTTLIGTSMASILVIGGTPRAAAETLVTCGPNGAAYIVEIVPAGCRLLAGTSAPKHNPVNTVKASRLGFTFNAAKPIEEKGQPVIAKTEKPDHTDTSIALW